MRIQLQASEPYCWRNKIIKKRIHRTIIHYFFLCFWSVCCVYHFDPIIDIFRIITASKETMGAHRSLQISWLSPKCYFSSKYKVNTMTEREDVISCCIMTSNKAIYLVFYHLITISSPCIITFFMCTKNVSNFK